MSAITCTNVTVDALPFLANCSAPECLARRYMTEYSARLFAFFMIPLIWGVVVPAMCIARYRTKLALRVLATTPRRHLDYEIAKLCAAFGVDYPDYLIFEDDGDDELPLEAPRLELPSVDELREAFSDTFQELRGRGRRVEWSERTALRDQKQNSLQPEPEPDRNIDY